MINLTIKIRKNDKTVELTLAELQDLHAQIEEMSSVATVDDIEENDDDWDDDWGDDF